MSKRQQRKMQKKLKKRRRSYIYKARRKKDTLPAWQYYLLLAFACVLETIKKTFKLIFSLIFFFCILGILGVSIVLIKLYPTYQDYKSFAVGIVAESTKEDFNISQTSSIYDNQGVLIAELYETAKARYLTFEEIPRNVVNAFVAVEDRSFWSNIGIDTKGLARVGYRAVMTKGDEVHGASTITQQLARNIFLTHEVSLERKAKEMLISMELTKKYSKQQIMEFYCNDICFANGIYGIEGASQTYFGKGVQDLSLAQITYLCAIPNSPEYYNPYKNSDRALERSHKILKDMLTCGYITEKEYSEAVDEKITVTEADYIFNDTMTTYAVDCAIKVLMKLDGYEFRFKYNDMDDYEKYQSDYSEAYELYRHRLYTGGYKVYTSLDRGLIEQLQGVLDEKLSFDSSVNEETGIYDLQGALTCIDNQTGLVVALVGGRSQENSSKTYSLNRAFQAYRQPGSSIKPLIVYAPALDSNKYTANSMVTNISVSAAKQKGADVQSLTGDIMTMRSAVERSKNGVAWKLFDALSPSYGLSFITNMRFSKVCPNDYFNASSLGGFTYGVTTVEMASGYATLANHGWYKEPTCIERMLDSKGNEVDLGIDEKQIYKVRAADDMVDILKGVLVRGTAAGLRWGNKSNIEAFAKTGTTNGSKDGWLCGATPYYSTSVWVGYDTPKTLSNLYGATYPGEIWRDCMLIATDGLDAISFNRDETDESYEEKLDRGDNYYTYLEGRDDSEILSGSYTVGNYREDRVIGESVISIINSINGLDASADNFPFAVNELYNQGCAYISTILSNSYKDELQTSLDTAYNNAHIPYWQLHPELLNQ